MPKGHNSKRATKKTGGQRRTANLPCGYIVQGLPDRLKAQISAHQKVCIECAATDCSYLWKKKFSKCPNVGSLQGSNSGCCNQYNTTQRLMAWDSKNQVEAPFTHDKVGGLFDTLASADEALKISPPTKVRSTNNKKKKGRKKKQKKPKVQSGWSQSKEDTEDKVVVLSFDDFGEDKEVDEDFYKVIQSITADLSMDEILEALTSRGAEVVSL